MTANSKSGHLGTFGSPSRFREHRDHKRQSTPLPAWTPIFCPRSLVASIGSPWRGKPEFHSAGKFVVPRHAPHLLAHVDSGNSRPA